MSERNQDQAKRAFGTQFQTKADNNKWVTVAEMAEIGGPSIEAEEIDTTTHDALDGYRTFVQGLKDAGEVEATLNFNMKIKSHTDALNDLHKGTLKPRRIVFPDADKQEDRSYMEFMAFAKGFEPEFDIEDVIKAEITFKVSGKPKFVVGGENIISGEEVNTGGDTESDEESGD